MNDFQPLYIILCCLGGFLVFWLGLLIYLACKLVDASRDFPTSVEQP